MLKQFLTPMWLFAGLAIAGCQNENAGEPGGFSEPAGRQSQNTGTGQGGATGRTSGAGQAIGPNAASGQSAMQNSASGQSATQDAATAEFIRNAGSSNQLEIRSSELALERSESDELSQFARRMIDDHRATGQRMAAVLNQAGLPAPVEPELIARHAEMLRNLEQVQGEGFDAAYRELQIDAHREAVSLFEDYSQNGSNPTVRDFAAQTLPDLRAHLDMVPETHGAE